MKHLIDIVIKQGFRKFIIFLNSGDEFFNDYSLQILLENSLKVNDHKSIIFGQANIIASKKINWFFPGKRLKNIKDNMEIIHFYYFKLVLFLKYMVLSNMNHMKILKYFLIFVIKQLQKKMYILKKKV